MITGGHLTPALAVIDELIKQGGWQIFFFGRQHAAEGDQTASVESKIIPDRGIPFIAIKAGRVQRQLNRYTFKSYFKIPISFFQAIYWLIRLRPDVVLSFGGYVSVPIVLAAWVLRIPVVTHEQTTVQGLATKINTYFAKKIAVSWPQTVKEFPVKKVVLTGNPIRKEIFKVNEKIWRALKFEKDRPLVFITGGNQGSHLINMAIESALPKLVKKYNVFHQCGHLSALGDFERLGKARVKLPTRLRRRYHCKKYLNANEMGTLLNKADLVMARAGANTITELVALGKPALLIPLPWLYQDEQTKNAQMLFEMGMAEILLQKNLSPGALNQAVDKLIKDSDKYKQKGVQAKKIIKRDAAKRIVSLVERAVR